MCTKVRVTRIVHKEASTYKCTNVIKLLWKNYKADYLYMSKRINKTIPQNKGYIQYIYKYERRQKDTPNIENFKTRQGWAGNIK